MTTLSHDFFVTRGEEIERWRQQGFIEIRDCIEGTEFVLEDLEELGVLTKKITLAGLEGLDGHQPTEAWHRHFKCGQHFTNFISRDFCAQLLSMLDADEKIQARVEARRAMHARRQAEYEKRVEEDCAKKTTNQGSTHDDTPAIDAEIADTHPPVDHEDEIPSITTPLSTTGLIAFPSTLFFLAVLWKVIGTDQMIAIPLWGLLAFLSYSPIRYIFRSGPGQAAEQLFSLAAGTFMLFFIGTALSRCSTSTSNCWYIVGCI